jgi:hypothetical protein
MGGPAVLVLDDGELDDIQSLLEDLHVSFGRVRGGAIVEGTPPPNDLLISTPRRIEAVGTREVEGSGPLRVVVVSEDSNALRAQLRRVGFDFLVRRPVHPEALRLLLLHCLYKGEEKRRDRRVPVGFEVSFRAGLLNRRATLADLSMRGCRMLSHTRIDNGRRIRIQIPDSLDPNELLTLTGRVLRSTLEPGTGPEPLHALAVLFDPVGSAAHEALEKIIGERSQGPATLPMSAEQATEGDAGSSESSPTHPAGGAAPGEDAAARVDVEVDVGLETSSSARPDAGAEPERRKARRAAYELTVPAFGNRALRVLVGRDLSMGGMRIERLPGIEMGDRLHLAIYGDPGDPPFLVWGTISRDDGEEGMALLFDPVDPSIAGRLESLVGSLPAVEDLHDSEVGAMGTVMSEILDA